MKKYRFLAVESAKKPNWSRSNFNKKSVPFGEHALLIIYGGGITSHEIDYLILQGGGWIDYVILEHSLNSIKT